MLSKLVQYFLCFSITLLSHWVCTQNLLSQYIAWLLIVVGIPQTSNNAPFHTCWTEILHTSCLPYHKYSSRWSRSLKSQWVSEHSTRFIHIQFGGTTHLQTRTKIRGHYNNFSSSLTSYVEVRHLNRPKTSSWAVHTLSWKALKHPTIQIEVCEKFILPVIYGIDLLD